MTSTCPDINASYSAKKLLMLLLVFFGLNAYGQEKNNFRIWNARIMSSVDSCNRHIILQRNKEKADAKQIAEEHKSQATITSICDMFIPPLCLLLIVGFAFALHRSEKGNG